MLEKNTHESYQNLSGKEKKREMFKILANNREIFLYKMNLVKKRPSKNLDMLAFYIKSFWRKRQNASTYLQKL